MLSLYRRCRIITLIVLVLVLYQIITLYFKQKIIISRFMKKPEVFRWDGNKWVQWPNFCTDSDTNDYILADLHSPAGKMPLYVHDNKHDSYTSPIIVQDHIYEKDDVALMYRRLLEDEEMGLVDVGSHVGLYSATAALLGRKTLSVDPLHMNMHAWCHTIMKNNFVDRARVINTIMSNKHRLMTFTTPNMHVGGTHVHEAEDQNANINTFDRKYIYSATLDDLLPLMTFKKAFLKIDVETHEFEVIAGGENFFHEIDVPYVLMEWVHHINGTHYETIINLMSKYGFRGFSTGYIETEVDFKKRAYLYNILWKRET